MNPYFQLLSDILSLIETPAFGAVVNDIKAIEGGSGNNLQTQGAHAALREAIAVATSAPAKPKPAVVEGPLKNPAKRPVRGIDNP